MRDKNALNSEQRENKSINFIIVTGLSGSGKSKVLDVLEDMGYYCVDNIPPELIDDFYMLCSDSNRKNVAVVTDVRSGDIQEDFFNALDNLSKNKRLFRILFLKSSSKILVNRYKETRRTHPLNGRYSSLELCVKKEEELLSDIEGRSDFVIDTSSLSPTQLKHRIKETFDIGNSGRSDFIVSCVSFGFKYGIPNDADLIFDARCFPNPFYIDDLKHLTGLDKPVYDYVMSFKESQDFLKHFLPLVDYLLPLYKKEGKNELVFAIGCTGGKHRSVAFTEILSKHIKEQNYSSYTFHRDINNK